LANAEAESRKRSSAFAHAQQDARVEGGPRGIGQQVSEFARGHGTQEPPPVDFADGVITVVKDEGGAQAFATFAEALAYADDGDTLQAGAGTYAEAIDLDESVTIVGEAGAVLDGSGIVSSAGTQATIELFDGFSGGEISGLEIVAIQGGGAVQSIYGEAVNDITLSGNVLDAGANTAGSLVYLNPNVDGAVIEGNTFEGAALGASPLLGVEGDNVQVTDNVFGETPGTYAKVEIFAGADGVTTDIVLVGNSGLAEGDIFYG
jgi:hypothetical protein